MSVERLIPEVLLDETTGAGAITVVTSGPFSKFMRSFLTDKEQQRMIKALVKRSVDGTTGESSMRADDEGDFSECHSQYVARAKRNLEQARKMQEIALAEVGVAEKELAIAQNKFEMIREKLQTTLQAGKLYRRVLEIDKLEAELQNVRERLSACKKRRKPEQVQSEDTQAEASIDEPKSKVAKIICGDVTRSSSLLNLRQA